jgi:hypothetical protein
LVQRHLGNATSFEEDRLDDLHIELVVVEGNQILCRLTSGFVNQYRERQSISQRFFINVDDSFHNIIATHCDFTVSRFYRGQRHTTCSRDCTTISRHLNIVSGISYNVAPLTLLISRSKLIFHSHGISQSSISTLDSILDDVYRLLVERVRYNHVLVFTSRRRIGSFTHLDLQFLEAFIT